MNNDLSVLPVAEAAALADLAPLYLHLSVTDPETVAALSESLEGRDRQELALTALKIGILSLKAARGTVDGAAIRKQISGFEEIKTSATTIVSGGDKILKRARLMEEEIGKRLGTLGVQMQQLRNAAGAGEA